MVSTEEKLLKERIRHLLLYKKTNIAKISPTPTLQARYGRQINGDATVPYSTIVMLLNMFHDISADWLVMGEGSMFKTDHTAQRIYNQHNEVHDSSAAGNINVGSNLHVAPSAQEVEKLQQRIAELEQDKAFLQNMLTAITNGIKNK